MGCRQGVSLFYVLWSPQHIHDKSDKISSNTIKHYYPNVINQHSMEIDSSLPSQASTSKHKRGTILLSEIRGPARVNRARASFSSCSRSLDKISGQKQRNKKCAMNMIVSRVDVHT